MKSYSFLIAALLLFAACQSQQQKEAKALAGNLQTAVAQNSPGSIPTSSNGYYMKCKVDGKDWEAVSMMPISVANRVIGNVGDGGYIGIGRLDGKEQPEAIFTIGEVNGADAYFPNDKTLIDKDGNVILMDKSEGKIKITKVDGEWMEGRFFFTKSSSTSDKKIVVTDGVFRVGWQTVQH
ncbi:MAG TPA: hypothetical protein VIJ95_17030 [Hanamia sp.]